MELWDPTEITVFLPTEFKCPGARTFLQTCREGSRLRFVGCVTWSDLVGKIPKNAGQIQSRRLVENTLLEQ